MNKFECAKANSCNVSDFEKWIASHGYAARDDADMDVLRDVYEAMDDKDK